MSDCDLAWVAPSIKYQGMTPTDDAHDDLMYVSKCNRVILTERLTQKCTYLVERIFEDDPCSKLLDENRANKVVNDTSVLCMQSRM